MTKKTVNGKTGLRGEKGTTLLELLVALVLSTLVISGLMSVYWLSNRAYTRQQNLADAQYSARRAREQLARDIRSCSSFEIWTSLNKPVNSPGSPGSRLHLSIVDQGTTVSVNYYVNPLNSTLYRYATTQSNDLPVASNIVSVSFSSPAAAPTLVNITINAQAGDAKYALTTSVKRRVD